jgi:hypothetical protein
LYEQFGYLREKKRILLIYTAYTQKFNWYFGAIDEKNGRE